MNLYQFAVTVQRDREDAHARRIAAEQQQPRTAQTQPAPSAGEQRGIPGM